MRAGRPTPKILGNLNHFNLTVPIETDCRVAFVAPREEENVGVHAVFPQLGTDLRTAFRDPGDQALLYWRALGAPAARIARALKRDESWVRSRMEMLSDDETAPASAPLSAEPWETRTISTLIHRGLSRGDDAPLVHVSGEGDLTAGDLRLLLARLCAGLMEKGVGKGDHVAVDSSQRLESYLVSLAALLCGATVVRLGDSVGPKTLCAMTEAAPSKFTFSDRLDLIGAMPQAGEQVAFGEAGAVRAFSDFLQSCPDAGSELPPSLPAIRPDDAAFVGFTSGSSGEPKAMKTSHEAVFRSTETAHSMFGFQANDIFCTATDFTALSSFRSLVTLPFISGGRVVIPDQDARSSPLALALLCEQHAVTRLTAVPTVLRTLNHAGDRLEPDALSALRTVFCGSGVLDKATAEAFRDRFRVPVIDYYGAREFATGAYSDAGCAHTMSEGGGWPTDCLINVADRAGNPVAGGESGEVMVHSDCMTLSDLPSIATDGIWSGWHATGDLGRILPDGRLEIVGRSKDVIKAPDGSLTSPAAIESVLNGLDWISESAAFRWTDDKGAECAAAALVVRPQEISPADRTELEKRAKRAVMERLGRFQTPARILILDDMPRVGRGKPDIRYLRRLLSAAAAGESGD